MPIFAVNEEEEWVTLQGAIVRFQSTGNQTLDIPRALVLQSPTLKAALEKKESNVIRSNDLVVSIFPTEANPRVAFSNVPYTVMQALASALKALSENKSREEIVRQISPLLPSLDDKISFRNLAGLVNIPQLILVADDLSGRTLSATYLGKEPILLLDLKGLTNLKSLADIPDKGDLTELRITRNNIAHIENNTFRGFRNLKKLNLRANYIKSIDWNAFAGIPQLEELNLGLNDLNDNLEPKVFSILPRLKWLYLDENKLSEKKVREIKAVLPPTAKIIFNKQSI
jgi:Leucine-rich repeat (LRR) protein